ncbi:MAG: GC-type dockerin domain-anchored protein [Phycisphaerales bacterium]
MTPESGIVSCPPTTTPTAPSNFNDVSSFINLYNNQLVPGDTTGDGEFNYFDISLFLNYFNGGC